MSDEASNMDAIVKAARAIRETMAGDRSDANVLARDLASCVIRQADEIERLRATVAELLGALEEIARASAQIDQAIIKGAESIARETEQPN